MSARGGPNRPACLRGPSERSELRSPVACVALVSSLALAGCTVSPTWHDAAPGSTQPAPHALPASGTVDYQLGGPSEVPPGASVVVRDATDSRPDVEFAICSVNAFQTQPADRATWLAERPDAVLRDDDGEPVVDPAWPEELVLDPGTPDSRAGIVAALRPVIDSCAAAGYDAIEFDNLDTFERFDAVHVDDALALAAELVAAVHARGLAAAQKNALSLGYRGRDAVGFDLLIVEECVARDECDAAIGAYGGDVIDIEYADQMDRATFLGVCAELPRLSVWRDRDLVPAGDPAYAFADCGP